MSDEQFLNDPELQHLARILGGLPLRPSERERSKILLACGRAEGHAEAQRKIRNLRAGMLVFAGVSACLLGLLLNRPFAPVSNSVPETRQFTENKHSGSAPDTPNNEISIFNRERIKTFGVMTPRSEWNQEPQHKVQDPSPKSIELVNQRPILTARSQAALEELLN